MIDLSKLRDILNIDEEYNFTEEYYKNTSIKGLPKVHFVGKVYYDYDNNIKLEGTCDGIMILSDVITLDDIEYPFSFDIDYILDENSEEIGSFYKKMQNTLDIMPILWQNIVLEVPMRITNADVSAIKTSGDGWELIDENNKEKEIDPRLAKLTELLDDSRKE